MGSTSTLIADKPQIETDQYRKIISEKINTNLQGRSASFKIVPSEGTTQGSFELRAPTNQSQQNNLSKSKPFNIVDDYKWTNSQFKEEVPRIHLVEYQIKQNQQLSYIKNIASGLVKNAGTIIAGTAGAIANSFTSLLFDTNTKRSIKDPYDGLYDADRTQFEYIFPYYSSNTVNTTVTWSSKIPPAGESVVVAGAKAGSGALIGNILEKYTSKTTRETAEKLYNFGPNIAAGIEDINAPFAGIEQPMWYTGTSKNSFVIKFPLFNTISMQDTLNNYDFVRVFAYQNLHLRTTFATYQPPVFYKCIQDKYWSELGSKPALYVSKYTVQNIGALRAIDVENKGYRVTIPEAYMIEITLSEMITTSRNIYSSVFTGQSINVGLL